jgi:hypothetical protein
MTWAKECAKEGVKVDWEHLLPPKGFQVLPRRWVVERTISWIDQNGRMSLATTRGYVRAAKRVGICCHESPHDEAVNPPLRPFHTASPRIRMNSVACPQSVLHVLVLRRIGIASHVNS